MNRRQRFKGTFRAVKRAVEIARTGGTPVTVESDTLASLAKEEAGWTRLSSGQRDLGGWKQTRMQEVAFYLFRNNHLARRILNIIQDFIVGDGVQYQSTNDEVQAAIKDFWNDPINQMDRLNGQRALEWQLWGEICLPVKEAQDGSIRIGWIDPGQIKDVIPHPDTGLPGRIVLTDQGAEIAQKDELVVIHWNDKDAAYEGDCFFATANTVLGGRRGVSEIFTASDWIDGLEELLFTQIDRSRLVNSFIWDVTLENADQPFIDAWVMERGKNPPEPASIRVHNQKETWNALSPQLGAYEMSRQSKDVLDYTLGGLGIPSHWYGSGDDANLATASVMAEPTRKMLKRKQKDFRFLLTDIVTYALHRLKAAGTLNVKDEDLTDFVITIPDFSGPDIGKVGASIAQLVAAVDGAVEGKYISQATGRSLVSVVFSELGAEIDPQEEAKEIDEGEGNEDKDRAAELEAERKKQQAIDDALAGAAARAGKVDGNGGEDA